MVDRGFVFPGTVTGLSHGPNRMATADRHHADMLKRWLEKLRERRVRRLVVRGIEEALGAR